MPSSATFRAWAARVPEGFLFAVKASRYLTHIRRLREPKEPVAFLMERAGELGPHLGPILLQLPPDMPADLDRLAATLDAFPPSVRIAFEPRHASWMTEDLRDAAHAERRRALPRRSARAADAAVANGRLGISALPCRPRSAGVVLHRRGAGQVGRDDTTELYGPESTVYAYFNNDHAGCALRDAAVFGRHLISEGVEVPHVPDIDDSVLRMPTRPTPMSRDGLKA